MEYKLWDLTSTLNNLMGGMKFDFDQRPIIIKDLFFTEIDLLTEDEHKESGLCMTSWIAQLKYLNYKSDY